MLKMWRFTATEAQTTKRIWKGDISIDFQAAIWLVGLEICEDRALYQHLYHGIVAQDFCAAAQHGRILAHQIIDLQKTVCIDIKTMGLCSLEMLQVLSFFVVGKKRRLCSWKTVKLVSKMSSALSSFCKICTVLSWTKGKQSRHATTLQNGTGHGWIVLRKRCVIWWVMRPIIFHAPCISKNHCIYTLLQTHSCSFSWRVLQCRLQQLLPSVSVWHGPGLYQLVKDTNDQSLGIQRQSANRHGTPKMPRASPSGVLRCWAPVDAALPPLCRHQPIPRRSCSDALRTCCLANRYARKHGITIP